MERRPQPGATATLDDAVATDVYLQSVETSAPLHVLAQDDVRDLLLARPGLGRHARRLIQIVFDFFSAPGLDFGIVRDLGLSSTTRRMHDRQLVHSRSVLRDLGNMSSPTVLFILRTILDDPTTAEGDRACALAFGPGLTVESAMLTLRRES